MKRYNYHIFICENQRQKDHPRGCCAEKNSSEIKAHFKKRIKELGLNSTIRANTAGCLDACEFGPTIVIYPDQTWYGSVSISDVDEIINEHILNNKPVDRLKISDSKFNKDGK